MNYAKPKRTFEKSGEVLPEKSYFVPLEGVSNTDNQDMKTMVDLGRYFSIFAPRQSGKTTYFKYFCRELEKDPTYIPILLSFQRYRDFDVKTFFQRVEKKLYSGLTTRLKAVNCPQLTNVQAFLDAHKLIDSDSFYELLACHRDFPGGGVPGFRELPQFKIHSKQGDPGTPQETKSRLEDPPRSC